MVTHTVSTPSGYVNDSTEYFINELEKFVSNHENLANNQNVIEALNELKQACTEKPKIIDWLAHRVNSTAPRASLTKEQLELLMALMMFRSSSTYTAIPNVVKRLGAISMHDDAAKINSNAKEETGDKSHEPHPNLLYKNFRLLSETLSPHCQAQGETTDMQYLNPASYQMARYIYRLRKTESNPAFGNNEGDFEKFKAASRGKLFPACTQEDFKTAVYICNLAPPGIADYHNEVLKRTEGCDEYGSGRAIRDPNDAFSLVVSVLELAVREASSVDEPGRYSYIGSYGEIAKQYLSYVRKKVDDGYFLSREATGRVRDDIMKWSDNHNDAVTGKAQGWEASAEEGHAKDACEVALSKTELAIEQGLSPDKFAAALHEVTELCRARLEFWNMGIERLESLGRQKHVRLPGLQVKGSRWKMSGGFF